MLRHLFDAAKAARIKRIEGLVMRENRQMLALAPALGFQAETDAEDPHLTHVRKDL